MQSQKSISERHFGARVEPRAAKELIELGAPGFDTAQAGARELGAWEGNVERILAVGLPDVLRVNVSDTGKFSEYVQSNH